jgi:hypothetical protein
VVDSVQGQLSATSANIFGQNAATISFQGQGTRRVISPFLSATETQSVDFAGRVTQARGGNQLELLGAQDIQDAYSYQQMQLVGGQGLHAAITTQQTTVDHNYHEFVSSDFVQPNPTYSLPIADPFALYDNNGNYLGELEDVYRYPTNFSHFEANFVEANGTVVPVTGQISPYAADAIGGYDSTIAFSGQAAGPNGTVSVSFNGRETEVPSSGIALAGELETRGYNRVPIYFYNPITSQTTIGTALVPYDSHEFAYGQQI